MCPWQARCTALHLGPVTDWVPDWVTKLKKSVYIDARNLKFCMRHPGTLSLRLIRGLKFQFVCKSISWLTSLLKFSQYRDKSCSGWDIFLKLFVDIFEMFVNSFKKYQFFCMPVSWLVGLLPFWNLAKIGIYPVLDEIFFCKFLETFLGCFYTIPK